MLPNPKQIFKLIAHPNFQKKKITFKNKYNKNKKPSMVRPVYSIRKKPRDQLRENDSLKHGH